MNLTRVRECLCLCVQVMYVDAVFSVCGCICAYKCVMYVITTVRTCMRCAYERDHVCDECERYTKCVRM